MQACHSSLAGALEGTDGQPFKTLQDEVRRPAGADRRDPRTHHVAPDATIIRQPGVRVGISTPTVTADQDDPEVAAWNARLAALNAASAAVESRRSRA